MICADGRCSGSLPEDEVLNSIRASILRVEHDADQEVLQTLPAPFQKLRPELIYGAFGRQRRQRLLRGVGKGLDKPLPELVELGISLPDCHWASIKSLHLAVPDNICSRRVAGATHDHIVTDADSLRPQRTLRRRLGFWLSIVRKRNGWRFLQRGLAERRNRPLMLPIWWRELANSRSCHMC